jgi:hypothetical protein
LKQKEEEMKRILLLLVIVLFSLPLSARPTFELAPRASLYISSVHFGLGTDLIINPTKNVGLRIGIAELLLGDNTVFSLNSLSQNLLSNVELLLYTSPPLGGIISYFDFAFGLIAGDGTLLTIGGGAGYETRMGKSNKVFLEPSIIITTGGDNTDVAFRLSGGLKFGIFR